MTEGRKAKAGAKQEAKEGDGMILCFDIGGSRIKAALAESGPEALRYLGAKPTPIHDFEAFLQVLQDFASGHALKGVAISIAGIVDPETRKITAANIPCAMGQDVTARIEAALGLPVFLLNDADAFALAEARQGAGRGHRNIFGVILGTGVGGGLILGGQLVQGAGGFAGEWGHGPVAPAPWDLPCGCGQKGCLDAVGAARGIERLHQGLHAEDQPSTAIVAAWEAGEARATRTVELWLDLMAGPLAMVVNVTGVSILPVGGGLASAPALIAALDQRLRASILRKTDRPLLVIAECQPEPGLIGAAEAGWEAFA